MWKLTIVGCALALLVVDIHGVVSPDGQDLVASESKTYAQPSSSYAQKPSSSSYGSAPSYTTAAPSYSSTAGYGTTKAPSYQQPSYQQASTASPSYQKRDMNYGHTYGGSYHGAAPVSYNMSSYNPYTSYSPWRSTPGQYTKESYGGARYMNTRKPYNANSVYASYLSSGPYEAYTKQCARSYGHTPKVSYGDLNLAFQDALYRINLQTNYERQQYQAGNYMNVSQYSSAARHQVASYMTQQTAPIYFKEKEAMFMEYASRYLLQHNCMSKLDAHYLLPQIRVGPRTGNPYGDNSCYAAYGGNGGPGAQLRCRDGKYRSYDGSCNNLYHPYWGKASVCHLRLVPPAYEDGIQKPRVSSYSGGYLPSARLISTAVHSDRPDRSYYTHMKMVWGQYANHDITFTPTSQANYKGGLIKCCPTSHHPQCFPIEIPANDYYQSKYHKTCMNFVRSSPCPLCTLGPRQQSNIATSFLDNGAAYGNSVNVNKHLRTGKLGQLRTQRDRCGKEILPATATPWEDQCSNHYPNMPCFDAGDPRVNQHPALQVVHLLWVRQHNQHARHLAAVNPQWGDEKLFNEARRISIAQLQYITYHEYLPIVFGPQLTKYFDLDVNTPGYTRYEPYTDPTTWNDYATAACRFGHSQIMSSFSLFGYNGMYGNGTGKYQYGRNGNQPAYWLKDWFFDPQLMYDCQSDQIVRGLLHDHAGVVDPHITGDIKNYLYKAKHEHVGSDLPAFNIQRSRDHGIPPYYVYLKFCFGFEATSWDDLGRFIPYEALYRFKKVYKHWKDVEFWPAGISENKFPDADVGPTFACVLGIQYYHLKFGDRYFFSHGHQTGSFTPAQLANIRQVTSLSAFLCHTGDYIDGLQKYGFFPESSYNPKIPCKSYPHINYNLWKDNY